jgi:hypothetical protein
MMKQGRGGGSNSARTHSAICTNRHQKIFFYSERNGAQESVARLCKTGRRQGGIQESQEELELANAQSSDEKQCRKLVTKFSEEK